MTYKKLILALVFAAFSFYFTEAPRAQFCDNPDFCFDFGIPTTIDNITGSHVQCVLEPGGASQPFNTLEIGSGLGTSTATFTQAGTATCTRFPDKGQPISLGVCAFELTMTGVTTSACNATNNSFTAGAFCQDPTLGVTGKVTCGSNVMELGIAGLDKNNECNQVFPKLQKQNTLILPAGKVLELTVTTDGSTGPCKGPFVALSNIKERYCNDGFSGGGVDCTPTQGPTRTTTPETTVNPLAVPFDFTVTQTVNTSPTFCKGGNPIDKGQAKVNIFGRANSFDVTNIDQTPPVAQPLQCEGVPLVCDPPTDLNGDDVLDLPCRVNTCPDFGPNLGRLPRNDDRTVTATCTGQLNSGTAILGTADVAVSPK
jgi:hypothetical protein